ncbi:dephospho-CoA kinase [Arthrobacter sp. ISL-30]|uniref:dephospho-CoA kinase n=1 Tax=Arthrobacter sp. ISL-30 TaxID=2819109 RepID=UPI001BE8DC06|nr:dephospho-CoA kinase [Arthrobacter sp. ISL-30]MBT2512938.1 dephospho-CoA kinase [Arthrobacter sp. ISL-30]
MLKIGLTGGIASGKSVVAARLAERGALLVDSDVLAREVVEPGSPGLARVVEEFGSDILDPKGRLDRAALGAIVFAHPERRTALNNIIHPLVRDRAAAIIASAGVGIVVQDIPLLVETGQGRRFHLVLVVDAPDNVRIGRMAEHRGMSRDEAVSRMAAQASREERLAAADVVLDNSGGIDAIRAKVDSLWEERLAPFARNLDAGLRAERRSGPVLSASDPTWPAQARRLCERLEAAAPGQALAVDHIGSTSVPGLDAKDVLDLQLAVPDLATADRIAPLLAAAGFPQVPTISADTPHEPESDPARWAKRFHANADPGRAVNLHVRQAGSPGWRYALCFRDWLRASPDAAAAYAAEKRRLAALHASDLTTAGYADAKEAWFRGVADSGMAEWAQRTAWSPPSYSSSPVGTA